MATPITSVLDSGVRADENPLSNGGKWSAYASDFLGALTIQSNQIICGPSPGTGRYGSYWSNQAFGARQEIYATVTSIQGPDLAFHLCLRIQNPGAAYGSIQCYELQWYRDLSINPFFYYVVRPAGTILATVSAIDLNAAGGDKVWFSAFGNVLQGYKQTGGVGAWNPIDGGVTDSTYPAGGNIGLIIDTRTLAAAASFNDFGGGTAVGFGPIFRGA